MVDTIAALRLMLRNWIGETSEQPGATAGRGALEAAIAALSASGVVAAAQALANTLPAERSLSIAHFHARKELTTLRAALAAAPKPSNAADNLAVQYRWVGEVLGAAPTPSKAVDTHTILLESGPVKLAGDIAAVNQAVALLRDAGLGYEQADPATSVAVRRFDLGVGQRGGSAWVDQVNAPDGEFMEHADHARIVAEKDQSVTQAIACANDSNNTASRCLTQTKAAEARADALARVLRCWRDWYAGTKDWPQKLGPETDALLSEADK